MKRRDTPNRGEIAEDDFNFTDVPAAEIESCLYYEYMRESEVIIDQVKQLRQQLPPKVVPGQKFRITKTTNHRGGLFEATMFLYLAMTKSFPEVPWQKLSESDKKRLLHFLANARRNEREYWKKAFPPLEFIIPGNNGSVGETTLNAWLAKHNSDRLQVPRSVAEKALASAPADLFQTGIPLSRLLTHGFFQANLNYSRDELRQAFDRWLVRHHPETETEPRTREGRKSPYDKLNALGALRLRYYCKPLANAQNRIRALRNKGHGMTYSDRRSWNRACGSAVRYFRTLLSLPDESLPLHFTKGWQK